MEKVLLTHNKQGGVKWKHTPESIYIQAIVTLELSIKKIEGFMARDYQTV